MACSWARIRKVSGEESAQEYFGSWVLGSKTLLTFSIADVSWVRGKFLFLLVASLSLAGSEGSYQYVVVLIGIYTLPAASVFAETTAWDVNKILRLDMVQRQFVSRLYAWLHIPSTDEALWVCILGEFLVFASFRSWWISDLGELVILMSFWSWFVFSFWSRRRRKYRRYMKRERVSQTNIPT